MGVEHRSHWCPEHEKLVRAERKTPNHILHLLLSIVTGGLWLVVWAALSLAPGRFRCPECGSVTYPRELLEAGERARDEATRPRGIGPWRHQPPRG